MADAKITELTAIDSIVAADLIALVDDVAGTPTTKKATFTQLLTYVDANVTVSESQISDLQSYLLNITGENLSSLADVTITGIASGEILKWNGAAWINNTLAEAGIAAASHTHTEADITDLGTTVAMVADNLSVFAATTSAQLAGVISDETGSGLLVFGTNPTLSLNASTTFTAAPTLSDGVKWTFNPNGTNAGINVGAHTAAPSSPANGDIYYNSTDNKLYGYTNSTWTQLDGGAGGTNALLDGSAHTDTAAQTVTRGSLIYGNATPAWDELVIGAANTILTSDGTDVSWTAGPVGTQQMYLPASVWKPTATSGAAGLTTREFGANNQNVEAMEFIDGADSYAYTTFVFPQNYNLGTITFRYIWFRENDEATPESKTVEFDMDAVALSNFGAIGGTAYGTAVSLSDTTDSTAAEDKFMESDFSSALTIAGTPADGDVISLRIMRDDSAGTMTGSAYLVGVMIEYTTDSMVSSG